MPFIVSYCTHDYYCPGDWTGASREKRTTTLPPDSPQGGGGELAWLGSWTLFWSGPLTSVPDRLWVSASSLVSPPLLQPLPSRGGGSASARFTGWAPEAGRWCLDSCHQRAERRENWLGQDCQPAAPQADAPVPLL